MKLRLKQHGFETYTGQMGVIFFENGVSTTDVDPRDSVRMSAVMQCEWENGDASNVAQWLLDNAETAAPILESHTGTESINPAPTDELPTDEQPAAEQPVSAPVYTEEQLAAIADEKGIAGLREIAEPMGIKNNSIRGLIADILAPSVNAD